MRTFIMIFYILTAAVLFGNPGQFGDIHYDFKSQMLTIPIMHDVINSPIQDPTKHYIKEVSISVNGIKKETKTYARQETPKKQSSKFKIVLRKDDKVEIVAICNVKGKTSTTYIVSSP